MESARPATEADLARLVELAHAMRVELGEERGGPLWATREARAEPLDAAFDALVGRNDAAVLASRHRFHESLAPPTKTSDTNVQHIFCS